MGFSGGSAVENPPANVGDVGLISTLGISLGEGNGSLLWYSCLGNFMDRGAWWAMVHRVTKESDTTEATSHHASIPRSESQAESQV